MKKQYYNVIGVMSGTSLDGIDLVYVHFEKDEKWSFSVMCSETVSYGEEWRLKLKEAIHFSAEKIQELDDSYTEFLATVINQFIIENKISDIDFVASHGHTIFHKPELGETLQIGNLSKIAKLIGKKVICDFRVDDVKLGGQGAPLVPIGDKLLFPSYNYCLNLGGFANVSVDENNSYVAFDICAVNTVLNHYVSKLGFDYDDGGNIAASGEVDDALLSKLNTLPFYKLNAPKSLGIEWVASEVFPIIDAANLSEKTILRTYVEHAAVQIAKVLNPEAKVLVTGGGAYNTFFINRLKSLTMATIVIPTDAIVAFKEAIIFGFLGVLKDRNEVNCLKSITGASKDHSSGKIYNP
ncbi:anhydro-N-acetylmuramic acid kinase [Joostella sp. CR20]